MKEGQQVKLNNQLGTIKRILFSPNSGKPYKCEVELEGGEVVEVEIGKIWSST